MDNDFLKRLDKLSRLEMNIKEPLTKACLIVENEAKKKAPVDKGQLRNSITHNIEGNSGEVGTNVEYAPYVEFGTGVFAAKGDGRQTPWSYQDAEGEWHTTIGQQPQPYLQPALNENKEKIISIFQDYIKRGLSE